MERVNLNLPEEGRARLKRMARLSRRREAEYARDLLLRALEAAEREHLAAAIRESRTPGRVARERQILSGLEALRGKPR
jgi:hypothetical protein